MTERTNFTMRFVCRRGGRRRGSIAAPGLGLGSLLLLMLWSLGPLTGWGQVPDLAPETAEVREVRLEVALGFSAQAAAPELSVTLSAQRGEAEGYRFEGHLRIVRSLSPEQTASWRIALTERLRWRDNAWEAEALWDPKGSSLAFEVQMQSAFGRFIGGLRWDSWGALSLGVQGQGDLAIWGIPLRYRWGRVEMRWEWGEAPARDPRPRLRVQGVELSWEPGPGSERSGRLSVRYDESQPLPLEVEIRGRTPGGGLEGRLQLRLVRGEWRELEASFVRDPLAGGLLFGSDEGWRRAWVSGRGELPLALEPGRGEEVSSPFARQRAEVWGRLAVGPDGWQGTEVGGRWEDLLRGGMEGLLRLAAPQGWDLRLEGRYFGTTLTAQGQLGWGPRGLARLLVLGQGTFDDLSWDGLFQRTGGFWLLNLGGALARGPWTVRGASAWSALWGWERATLGIGRTLRIGVGSDLGPGPGPEGRTSRTAVLGRSSPTAYTLSP